MEQALLARPRRMHKGEAFESGSQGYLGDEGLVLNQTRRGSVQGGG